MRKLLFVISLLSIAPAAWANHEIIEQYQSARSCGMGGLKTTTGLYDDALFGNPALHAMADDWKVQILNITAEANDHLVKDFKKFKEVSGKGGAELFSKIADSGIVGRNEHERISNITGFYTPKFFSDSTAFAFGIVVNEQANVMLRSNTDLDLSAYVDTGIAVGLAKRWWDGDLLVGVNVRPMYRLATDRNFRTIEFLAGKKLKLSEIGGQGMGVDGDIGGYYKLPLELPVVKLSVGGSLNNVVGTNYDMAMRNVIKTINTTPPKNVRNGNLGVRVDLDNFAMWQDNKVAVEMQNIGSYPGKRVSTWKRLHMGAETKILFKLLVVRGGFNQGYYTAGLGLNIPILKIDVATYGEEMGANAGTLEDRRYVARIGFEL